MNTESFGRIATATATTALSIATVAGVGHVVDHRVRVQQVEVLAQLGATASSLREPRSGGGVLGTSALSALRTEMSGQLWRTRPCALLHSNRSTSPPPRRCCSWSSPTPWRRSRSAPRARDPGGLCARRPAGSGEGVLRSCSGRRLHPTRSA